VTSQVPQWLQEFQATAAVATTIGVLIALYVALIRDPRQAAEDHRHHMAQMEALRRAARKRAAAQARKIVPSCIRTPMLGDSRWIVRIENASNTLATIIAVHVIALDTNGFEVSGGCKRVNNFMPVNETFDPSIDAALSESFGHALEPHFTQALRDAMASNFVKEWPRTLPPNQHAVMAYTTTDPNYRLRISIEYEDHVGYQWRRTDTTQPTRTDEEDDLSLPAKEPR
jgi:hypothetical protein